MTGILTLIMSRQVINKWHLSAHITVLKFIVYCGINYNSVNTCTGRCKLFVRGYKNNYLNLNVAIFWLFNGFRVYTFTLVS